MSEQHNLRKAIVFLLIGTLILLLLTSCAASTTSHKTYNYANFVAPAAEGLHAGDQISLIWNPMTGRDSTEATPTRITISAELFGPFSSLTALEGVINQDAGSCSTVSSPRVTSITPIQTDDWTNKTYQSTLSLPQSIAPGYYELVQKVSSNGNGNGGCDATRSVVQIKAQ
jgi:hypothetical protein